MNDRTLFIVVGIGLAAYVLTVLIENGLKAYHWIKHQRAMEQVDDFIVPEDYNAVSVEAARLNCLIEQGSLTSPKNIRREQAIIRIREKVARIRMAGYVRGEAEQANGVPFSVGVAANPHKPGSGTAKQWVRGYCQARNVTNPKPYVDAA
jgi:hypothetical protein